MRNYKNPLTYALYLLELRDRSIGEIKDKMRRKKFSDGEITKTIDFLLSKNFLDDEKFAERFAKEKQELQHWGWYRIQAELRRKFISNDIIEHLIKLRSENNSMLSNELNGDESDEMRTAREAADLWRRKNPKCPKEKIYSRLGGFLSSRGFSYDLVKEILNDFIK